MEVQSTESLYRLLRSLPDRGPGDNGDGGGEPLTSHRRGHWFKSSIAHHLKNNIGWAPYYQTAHH